MRQTVETALGHKTGTDELICVDAGALVTEAVHLMAERQVGAVLIRNEDGLVDGIFTERDLLVRVVHAGRDPAATPISLVMTRSVRHVTPGTTVEAALALMHVNRHRHLLVLDGPHVHGLLSLRDLAYHLVTHGEGRTEAAIRAAAAAAPAAPAVPAAGTAP
jgi:CBS domain-containing protein